MSITIEEGKFYRTRDGKKVGPMVITQWDGRFRTAAHHKTWLQTGRVSVISERSEDLVDEWADEPAVSAYDGPLSAHNMTLRDWFAGQAMAGLLAAPYLKFPQREQTLSMEAYGVADAMLRAREDQP